MIQESSEEKEKENQKKAEDKFKHRESMSPNRTEPQIV